MAVAIVSSLALVLGGQAWVVYRISRLEANIKAQAKSQDDHEQRIRKLEGQAWAHQS